MLSQGVCHRIPVIKNLVTGRSRWTREVDLELIWSFVVVELVGTTPQLLSFELKRLELCTYNEEPLAEGGGKGI